MRNPVVPTLPDITCANIANWMKNHLRSFICEIDIDEIFPMQSSDFTELLYFGSYLKKNLQHIKKYIFSPKMYFYR